MVERTLVLAICLAIGAVIAVLLRGRNRKSSDVAPAPVFNASPDDDFGTIAERLVVTMKEACRAQSVSLRRWEYDSAAEIAAVGPAIELRDLWIEETHSSQRVASVGRTLLVPVPGCSKALATLVIEGATAEGAAARAQSLAEQAAPLLADAALPRDTKRMLAIAQSTDLDQVFEALSEGVAVTNDAGALIRVNQAGKAILAAAAQGGDCNPLQEALCEGRPTTGMEVAFSGPKGGTVVELQVAKLSRSAESRAVVAILRDVTRARTLEHELRKESAARARYVDKLERKQKELEQATRHKSEFLANMSHELRTPLNGIIGFTEILLEGTYGSLNAKQSECARDVLDGGRHLLGLINDILDVAKIEAGKMELSREDVALDALVNNALTLVRPQAARKELQITVEVPAGLTVHCDADRLRQVLLNFLSNAVKFTPASGSIRLFANVEGKSVRISVADTGVGIAPEDQDKLFKDFSQVDSSSTRRFGGTGLGLSICKKLVELHGGTVGFTSKPKEGSTFWFELPRAMRTERPPFATKSPLRTSSVPRFRAVPGSSQPKTLIVDGHGPSRRIAARSLCDAGIDETSCETLADARAAVARSAPAAIVIDPSLPDATPAEAMAFAVANAGDSVIVTSTQSVSELSLPENVRFVQKPVNRANLVDEVSRAIARTKERPRVAIVVDDAADGGATAELLRFEGMRTELVSTRAEAHALMQRLEPDLVVLELDLPDGDGVELLHELADHPRTVSVVLTHRALEGKNGEAVQALATITAQKGSLSRSGFLRRLEAALKPEKRARARVLAVDDNDQNLRLITALLCARGYDVIEAHDATTAIDFAQLEKPDLVLMDVMLPGLDGLTATRMLADDPRTRAIPVIAISANAMPEDHAKARAAGCCAYVTKPIDVQTFLAAVGSALRTDAARAT